MGKYFTFVDRSIQIEFFDKDPVKITLCVGDEMDRKLNEMGRKMDAAATFEDRKAALADTIGVENVDAIMARAETQDNYALLEIAHYLLQEYQDGKTKNLVAARAGRKRK